MARHIRIPFLLDLILVRDAATIRALADHAALDRGFSHDGPLLNRILAARVRRGLRLGAAPLPSARLRDDGLRRDMQEKLSHRFAPGLWDEAALDALAEAVAGRGTRPLAHLAQEIVGRAFRPDYAATEATWAAAEVIDDHLSTRNPFRRFRLSVTNALPRAQRILGEAVGHDPAGVHGTGVAIHNLVTALERMAADLAEPTRARRLTPEAAALCALTAPRTVLRAGARDADTPAGTVRPTTLVALQTRAAARMDADLAFLSSSWSRCPADRWVPALLAEIWRRAGDAPGDAPGAAP